jgi:hypothetical protein
MTRLNLVLQLLDTTTHLLQSGITRSNIHEAHHMMAYSFDRFEEFDGIPVSELGTILDGITIKIMDMSQALKAYFQAIENFTNENEIFLCDLPPKFNDQKMEQVQLMVDLFTIFNDLLEIGLTSCHVHEARIKIDELFNCHETANNA